jgi:hypothetical protein
MLSLREAKGTNAMANQPHPEHNRSQPTIYQVRIAGHLDNSWADWFDGLAVSPQADGTTILTATIVDQAALYGLLRKVRDLGMPLLTVQRMHTGSTTESATGN